MTHTILALTPLAANVMFLTYVIAAWGGRTSPLTHTLLMLLPPAIVAAGVINWTNSEPAWMSWSNTIIAVGQLSLIVFDLTIASRLPRRGRRASVGGR